MKFYFLPNSNPFMKKTLSILLLSMSIAVFGQIDSLFPIGQPRLMSSTINSGAEEDLPLLSHDGNEIYFCRTFHPLNIGGKFAGQDIWCAHKESDSIWSKSTNIFPSFSNEYLNDEYNNVVVGISNSGDTLYLLNHYHHHKRKYKHNHHHKKTKPGLSFSVYQDSAWQTPQEINIPELNFSGHHYGLYMNPTGDVLLISEENENFVLGKEDLYVSVKEGNTWSKIIHLGDKINSESIEFAPFISSDKKTLFFASDKPSGLGGFDIYYSQRLDDTWQNWTNPVNLGPKINSTGFDAYLSISDDNHVLYVQNKDTLTSDIWIADILDPETMLPKKNPNADSVLLSTLIDPDTYLNMERLVNLDTIVQAKDILAYDPNVHKNTNIDSLIYEAALDFVDKVNTDKGYKVVDLEKDEVRHLETEELDSLKVIPRGVTIQFDYNLNTLDDDSRNVLSKVVYLLKNGNDLKVTIIGHTCAIGSEGYNHDLSKQRAIAAKKYLAAKGIDKNIMNVKWQGELKPIADNVSEDGRRKNRRVEISFAR